MWIQVQLFTKKWNENTVKNELLIPQVMQTQQASSSNISIFKINKKSKTYKTISKNSLTNYFHVIPQNIDSLTWMCNIERNIASFKGES